MSAVSAGNRWAIVLSSHAVGELRKLERNQKVLDIVHTKLKELSFGHFSAENYRIITGTSPHIPLFEARTSNDLRIIYQIDICPDPSGNYDHQVIKIYRIAPRVNYRLWVKVSVRLKRVKLAYRERCMFRLPRTPTNSQRPAMFPHEEYGLGISNQDSGFLLRDLTAEENDQIQGITMERFAKFDKSLYNCVVADLNMALPMVLDEHERKIVGHVGASIVIGRSGTGKTTALIYKMRAIDQTNATQGTKRPVRQLFVTRSRVLAQHVESTYRGLLEYTNIAEKSVDELREMAMQSREDPDRALVEFDSEVDLRDDLPERFSSLEDSHFPLFISFDKLCALLEADIRHVVPTQINSLKSRSLVGFDEFVHNYWPSFRGIAQALEPNLVYSEIIGVIKGSQAALESPEGYLSKRQYVGLSHRHFPLLAPVREKVYSIFEIYAKNKIARADTDPADRTRLIMRNLRHIIEEPMIDYLYVDEVQDNLMIDVHLLRSLAKNINNIYWSGDSAQTVVAGSAFRINDLKAFTYREQADASITRSSRKAPAQFTTFELNVNFRSLSGIVQFAGSVVQSIYELFPDSIDSMETEKAKYYGDPPVLFTDIQSEAGYFEKFLLGSSTSNRVVFGAQQAILVRDAEAAEQLDARLQGLCNVLPIMDSKGLEFDDVLIYNFFSQSAAPQSAWEHLLGNARSEQAPPPVLCSELKLLYVAATRARHRCWIWDSSPIVDQLRALWTARDLIKVEPASQMIGRMVSTSSKSEWTTKGREFFSHRLYKLAAACFRQAGQENDAKLSLAYHLMTRAKLKRLRGDTPVARAELLVAASELETCANLPGIGNASNVHYHAATCYEAARDWVRASAAFIKAGRHTHGVQILFGARDFNNGARALVENRKHLEVGFFNIFLEQSRQHFFSRREYHQLHALFDTIDEKVAYARDHNFKVELKCILDEHHRYDELAEEYLKEDNLSRGVEYYVSAYRHHGTCASISQAVRLALGLAQSVLLVEGVYRKIPYEQAKSLIEMVHPFASQADADSFLTVDLFHSYLCLGQVNLDMVTTCDREDTSRGTLARYLAIKKNGWLQDDSIEVVLAYLGVWESFKTAILSIADCARPCTLNLAQKLLGFSFAEKDTYKASLVTVWESSLIYHRIPTAADGDAGVPAEKVDGIIRQELPKRILGMLDPLHAAALASPWTQPRRFSSSPLVPFLNRGSNGFIPPDYSYAPKIYVLCRVLTVLDMASRFNRYQDPMLTGQQWLQRMFTLAYPANGKVEGFAVLRTTPESRDISKCLYNWLQRDWDQLCDAEASDTSIAHLLLHSLVRSALFIELIEPDKPLKMPMESVRSETFKEHLVLPLRGFFSMERRDRFVQAIIFIKWLLNQNYRVDAAVLVHFVEMLTREMILHMNADALPDFDMLLMPGSWMHALANKYAHTFESTDSPPISKFLPPVQQLSLELRFGAPGRWHIDGKQGSPAMIDMLNLRLCWCLAFVIVRMDKSESRIESVFDALRRLSSDDMPQGYNLRHSTAAGPYHEFSNVTNHQSCLEALRRTFRHETLLLVSGNEHQEHPARHMPSVHTIISQSPSTLAKLLDEKFHDGPRAVSGQSISMDEVSGSAPKTNWSSGTRLWH